MTTFAYIAIEPRDADTRINGLRSAPEAASLTIKKGTPIVFDSAGRLDAAASTFTSVLGISAEDGHNGTAGQYELLYWPIKQGSEWRIALNTALAQTDLGDTDVGLAKDTTTGLWYASTSDTGAQARIVDYVRGPAGGTIGDTKAPVYIVFHTTKLQVT